MAAPRTQVLVLGSVHLSQLPKGSDIGAAGLQPLMDRLAAYKPTIITVENLSVETCDLMRRHPAVYLPEDTLPIVPTQPTLRVPPVWTCPPPWARYAPH